MEEGKTAFYGQQQTNYDDEIMKMHGKKENMGEKSGKKEKKSFYFGY